MPASEAAVLPGAVRPVKYWIKLQPDLDQFTFQGEERISIEVAEPTLEIVLNAVELQVETATLLRDGVATGARRVAFDKSRETVTLDFGGSIAPGQATLEIKFAGELNDKLCGFYRSRYTASDGEERYLAATQFEATDARRAFPCWDEPARKARFEVTLVIPSGLVAVSNTPPVEESGAGPDLKTVHFAETPVMSTYLLAFVVGDLTHIEQQATDTTRVAVWTTRGKEEQGRFALNTSVQLLSFFNDYFGIPYPLEKLDHIAIPDFAAGAMENWGAITYREIALLVDPVNSSAGTRQRVAEVIAHEMAHMWFGDLVTMEWWDDLWLNESFASWMGNKAVDWLFPEWEMWTQFVNMDTNRALSLDGLKNSHPIEQEVKNPAEVSQLFDAISYSKGASVIRMLEQFLGPDTFQRGLQKYLSSHQYSNARTADLWSALEVVSGQPVTSIMDSWTKQMGYPVLRVETRGAPDHLELEFSQERFVYDSLPGDDRPGSEIWRVPVRVSYGAAEPAFLLMDGRQVRLPLPGLKREKGEAGRWFKVNPRQTGFFRVNYQTEDWERLVPAIRSLELPAPDRLGVQNDAYSLSRAGLLPVTQFLSLAQAYGNEADASVWGDLSSNLRDIDVLLADEPNHDAFVAFARSIFRQAVTRVGWDARPGEGHLDSLLRSTVLSQAGSYDDTEVLRQARDRFERFLTDPGNVHPDIRGAVFGLAGQTGDRTTYDQLWKLEKEATLQEEKMRLLMAVTRFDDRELLLETLKRALTSDVRSQDTVFVVTAVGSNRRGRDLAWEFVKDNWPEFDRRYGSGGFGLMRLVSICGNFASSEKLADVETFFAGHPAPAAERTIRQALERVRLNIKWLERSRGPVGVWLGAHKDAS
jgi:puromycin-sensitive aminopeptidase